MCFPIDFFCFVLKPDQTTVSIAMVKNQSHSDASEGQNILYIPIVIRQSNYCYQLRSEGNVFTGVLLFTGNGVPQHALGRGSVEGDGGVDSSVWTKDVWKGVCGLGLFGQGEVCGQGIYTPLRRPLTRSVYILLECILVLKLSLQQSSIVFHSQVPEEFNSIVFYRLILVVK